MNHNDYFSLIGLILTLATLIGTCWNSWMHSKLAVIVAELQLNLRREFNGRYVAIERFNDLKSHLRDQELKNAGHKGFVD